MSANADYDVKIVESFAPPKNFLPGQEVNKDVYATNTGNIAAFVKESISGRLTVTKEQATKEKTANSITITGDERYAVEAGAYLAYAPDGSTKKLGSLVVVRPDDQGVPKVTDFAPDVTGLYVFRRTIDVDATSDPVGKEKFTYDGYYYDATEQKYYKISNLQTAAANAADYADDGVFTDGNLAYANAGFVEDVKEVINPTAMTYDGTGHRLVIEYDTGNNAATSALEQAAAARDAALHNLQYALELVAAAQSESTTADEGAGGLEEADTALTDAYNAYVTALGELDTAERALTQAKINNANAKTALTAAENAVKASKNKLYGADDGTESTATPGSLKGKLTAATTAKGSVTETNPTAEAEFTNELTMWISLDPATTGRTGSNRASLTVADLELFKAWVLQNAETQEKHDNFELLADYAIAKKNYDDEYTKLYGDTIDNGANESDGNYSNDSIWGKYKAADAAVNGASGTENAESEAKSERDTKYNAVYNAIDGTPAGKKALYEKALADYNAALSTSNTKKAAFEDATAKKNAAEAALVAAETAYTDAANALNDATKKLKIYVNLENDVTGTVTDKYKWELLPTDLVNNTADFYYTGILEGGETSSKLIDSIELDENTTQDMYKSFDFDLDVKLDSAQIAYASDDTTIVDDAARAEFGRYATITNPTSVENAVLDWN